jgi:hypothetical protein
VRAAVTDLATVAAGLDQVTVPPAIADWLGELALLDGVPLGYLVPDPDMLPPESIRFFQLDPNWIVALLGGATSVGRASTADLTHDQAVAAAVHAAVGVAPVVSGFILRSALVAGWPEIDVLAWETPYGDGTPPDSDPLPNLRVERIAPGVLFVLIKGMFAQLHLREPTEALHFGLELADDGTVTPVKPLRRLSSQDAGALYVPAKTATAVFRGDGRDRVLDIEATAAAMSAALSNVELTSAELGLELVAGTQSFTFTEAGK